MIAHGGVAAPRYVVNNTRNRLAQLNAGGLQGRVIQFTVWRDGCEAAL